MATITSFNLEKENLFGNAHRINVKVKTDENDSEVKIFSYYPDELSFTEDELLGLTIKEAHELRHKKDVAYLQS